VAERDGTAAQPDFLTVDHDKRREAIERGRRLDPAGGAADTPPRSRWSRLAGYAATAVSALTLFSASIIASAASSGTTRWPTIRSAG
jgi:hypothetical protein